MSLRDKVTKEIGELFAVQADGSWFIAEKYTESPIETAFGVALEWCCHSRYEACFIKPVSDPDYFTYLSEKLGSLGWTHIQPQAQLGDHRVDFLITFRCGDEVETLIVECDGHDFHDRTHDQASRDRERDRALVMDGHKVFRFTGTDINRRAIDCAYEVVDFIWTRRAAARKRREDAGTNVVRIAP